LGLKNMTKAIRRSSGTPGAALGQPGIGLALALLTGWFGLGHPVSSAATEEAAVRAPDTSEMVRIPAGKFWYGCKEQLDSDCDPDEQPGKWIESPEFWVDRTEVTVEAFQRCALANACSTAGLTVPFWKDEERPSWSWACNWNRKGREKHPINCVNWNQARTFCEWAGKRLPSEEEWERAARGMDGWKYPWGNAGYEETGPVANIADETLARERPRWPAAKGYDDGFYTTAPVGTFPAGSSPEGALDMLGNVWEWTSSWSDADLKYRVARGGSWANAPQLARASNRYRFNPVYRGETFGFRCVSQSSVSQRRP
jgi:formylglycine-generating enzyme required for sulfatase activity